MGRRQTDVLINLEITGSKVVGNEIGKVSDVVARTVKEVNNFAKNGGLGAIATGGERIKKAQTDIAALAIELQDAENAAKELRLAISETSDESEKLKLNKELVQVEQRAASAAEAIAKIPVELRESNRAAVGFLGDIDTAAQTFAGTINNLFGDNTAIGRLTGSAGGGLAKGLQTVGDIAATAEQLPLLSSALATSRQRVVEFIASKGGYTAAIQAGTKAIAPFVAAMVAFVAVQEAGRRASEQARAPLVGFFEDLDDNIASLDLTGRSVDDLQNAIKEQERYQTALQENANNLRFVSEAYDNTNDATSRVAKTFASLGDRVGVFDNPINEVRSELDATEDQLKDTEKELTRLNEALEQAAILAEREAVIKELINGLETSIALELELNALRQQGSDAIIQQIETWRSEADTTTGVIEEQFLTLRSSILSEIGRLPGSSVEQLQAIFGDLDLTNLDDIRFFIDQVDSMNDVFGELTPAQQELVASLRTQIDSIDELREKADLAESEVLPLAQATEDVAESAERATENQKALVEAQQQLADAQQSYSDFIKKRAADDLKQATRDSEVSALQNRITAAKAIEAEQERQNRIVAIIKDSGSKITDAYAQLADENAKAVDDFSKKQGEINSKFMESELKATQKFQREQLKSDSQHAKDRLRALQDMNASLLDAALENDVNAFLAAQRSGEQELERIDEDAKAARDERSEQFRIEREEARNQRIAQLTDLRQSFNEEQRARQQAAQERIAQIRAETQERIQAERESAQVQLKESERLQQQLAELRAKFQQQDALERRRLEEEAFRQRIQDAKRQLQEELRLKQQGAQSEISIARGVVDFVAKAASSVSNVIRQVKTPQQGFTAARNVARKFFATGDVVDEPTLSLLGETPGFSEAVIPFRPSEGLDAALAKRGLGGGKNIQVTIPVQMTVGDIATGQQVKSQLIELERRVAGVLMDIEFGGAG